MKNEEQGSLRTDESSRLGRDGAGWLWGLERLAANTRYRRGGVPVGVGVRSWVDRDRFEPSRCSSTPIGSSRRSTATGPGQGLPCF
jgi:hypothetical protein